MPRLVRFRQLLNPVKKDLFLKFLFRKTQKVPYEILTFLLGKLYHKYILPYTVIILLILNTEFGLIRITHWPDEKELFLKFAKVRNSRNSQNSVWEPNFFPRQALPIFFLLYTLITLVILHTAFGLIWTNPDENPMKKTFFKNLFSRNSKFSYEILTFFRTR